MEQLAWVAWNCNKCQLRNRSWGACGYNTHVYTMRQSRLKLWYVTKLKWTHSAWPRVLLFSVLAIIFECWKSSLSALSLSIRARRALDHGWNPCETTRFWLSIPKNLQFSLVPILLRQSMAISYFQPDPRWSKGGVGQTFPMTKVAFKYPMIFSWYSHDIGSGDTPNHPGVDQFRSLFRPQSPEAPGRATSSAVYHQWGPWPTCHRRIPRRTSQGISPWPFSGDHVSSCVFFGFPLTFFLGKFPSVFSGYPLVI